jgi:hypothetical protein
MRRDSAERRGPTERSQYDHRRESSCRSFRSMKREKELDREILAFSISHDHTFVRIYGHYLVIEGDKTTFYRHSIHKFDFTALDGKEKWIAYEFIKNVYDTWMPI